MGISLEELKDITVGEIVDIFTERLNDDQVYDEIEELDDDQVLKFLGVN
ncbi:hypothetical protein [Aminipila terrae]|nr:hypothetical protein [Aminipila terrae]